MKETVYIFSSGRFKRKDNTLLFISAPKDEFDTEKKRFIPVERIKESFIFGEVDLDKRVLEGMFSKLKSCEACIVYIGHPNWYHIQFFSHLLSKICFMDIVV